MKQCIFADYRYQYYIYPEQELKEMLGEDYLEEYGVELPEYVLTQYFKAKLEFEAAQDLLRKYYDR